MIHENNTTLTLPLTPEARNAFTWVKTHAEENNLPRKELARLLGYDESTVCRIVGGNYHGNPERIVSAINRYRTSLLARIESPAEFPFIQTAVARTIHDYIDLAVQWRKIGIVIAESQTGKSRAARQYRYDSRTVLYVRLPQGGHKSKTVLRLCDQLGVSDKYNTPQREKRVFHAITRDHVLIVDELQQCSSRAKSGGRMTAERIDTVEWLRELKDETGCALVFIGTTEALRMLNGEGPGHESGHILIQTVKRALDPLKLANNPPRRDLNAFAKAIGLDPAEGEARRVQDETVIVRGLEIWLTYLLAGAAIASGQKRPVTWDDIFAGRATFGVKDKTEN